MTVGTRNRFAVTALLVLLTSVARPAASAAAVWSPTPAAADSPTAADFVGRWQGVLTVGDNDLRLVFEVDRSDDGTLHATLDSPDQGATGIPVAAVTVDGSSIRFDVRVLAAEYEGRLADDRQAIDGEWRQSGMAFPLDVEREP